MTLGSQVFELRLPLELAPTLNEYACMKGWKRARLRTQVDERIVRELGSWSGWHAGFNQRASVVAGKVRVDRAGGRRRAVVVERHSSRRLDEVSCDVIGGKLPIDRLVQAGVLVGDSAKWLEREARWVAVRPGAGLVILSVHDLISAIPLDGDESG